MAKPKSYKKSAKTKTKTPTQNKKAPEKEELKLPEAQASGQAERRLGRPPKREKFNRKSPLPFHTEIQY
jgi:hypothetical protein